MSPPPLSAPARWLITAAFCVVAIAAVLITVPTVLKAAGRKDDSTVLAPKLAALSDQQLAELLPKSNDFPPSWTISDIKELSDTFGYIRYHVNDEGLGISPPECFSVVGVASTGAYDAAEVFAHDPADSPDVAARRDIRLMIGREFDPAGFGAFTGLVSRCLQFSSAAAGNYTVHILEDSHNGAGPQRFRYSVSTTIAGESADAIRTDYYSYARTNGLILTGTASTAHQQALDTLFDSTLRRIAKR
ncbi:hypothetical protein A5634_10175 [Mycobacterium asiaticum]|uniref:PknH-like extracellular domain-containing protein n=1 Tax=Mycobacterium asiaticum TaxID=1790 RepID=A0A1A3NHV7_MYCAS|nr:hypothetical protein [Mycobacterium asiaticum]OBK21381.1 hypothetical protein A5634_10175 [Mycobacterium asiaticum]